MLQMLIDIILIINNLIRFFKEFIECCFYQVFDFYFKSIQHIVNSWFNLFVFCRFYFVFKFINFLCNNLFKLFCITGVYFFSIISCFSSFVGVCLWVLCTMVLPSIECLFLTFFSFFDFVLKYFHFCKLFLMTFWIHLWYCFISRYFFILSVFADCFYCFKFFLAVFVSYGLSRPQLAHLKRILYMLRYYGCLNTIHMFQFLGTFLENVTKVMELKTLYNSFCFQIGNWIQSKTNSYFTFRQNFIFNFRVTKND